MSFYEHRKVVCIRNITNVSITENKNDIIIKVRGDGFLYNMVRIMVGTLIEIGENKRDPNSIKEIILKRNRKEAGFTVPGEGLYLEKTIY